MSKTQADPNSQVEDSSNKLTLVITHISSFGQELAFKAGEIMMQERARASLNFRKKSDGSEVTHVDEQIQKLLDRALTEFLPGSVVIGEESFSEQAIEKARRSKYVWIVDPLDGSKDYLAGSNRYCMAILLLENWEPVYTLIYAPEYTLDSANRYSLFEAIKTEDGARLNGRLASVNKGITSLEQATVARYISSKIPQPFYYKQVGQKALRVIDNQGGSGLINIGRIASSAVFPELEVAYLKPTPSIWDILPGVYLIQKAGGQATYDDGRDIFPLDMNLFDLKRPNSIRIPSVILSNGGGVHTECLKLAAQLILIDPDFSTRLDINL